jgi:hypothetical protein
VTTLRSVSDRLRSDIGSDIQSPLRSALIAPSIACSHIPHTPCDANGPQAGRLRRPAGLHWLPQQAAGNPHRPVAGALHVQLAWGSVHAAAS